MNFRHSEYVRDITSTTNFQVTHENIIPTNTSLFPLLSQFANNFEKYRFNYLVFYYKTKTSSSSASSITSLGTVIYCIKYDPTLPDFTSKNEMQNYEGAQTCRTDNNLSMKCYVSNRFLYNRPGGLSRPTLAVAGVSATDIRNEVIGKLAIATAQQGQGLINIGELWVDYDVSFQKAKLYQALGGANRGARYLSLSDMPGRTNVTTPIAKDANTMGGFSSNPTQTSCFWDELNVQFISPLTFEFDAIDGAVMEVSWKYSGLGSYFGSLAATTVASQTLTLTLSMSAGLNTHVFIAGELDPRTPQITPNGATVGPPIVTETLTAPNPRTATNYQSTANSATFNIATASTLGLSAAGTAEIRNGSPPLYIIAERKFYIKCRGTQRVSCSWSIATIPFAYSNVQLEIMVLDRPNSFPQNTTTSVLNNDWFTP